MSSASLYSADTALPSGQLTVDGAVATFATSRWSSYLILVRPRIAVLTAISVAVGFTLGSENSLDWLRLWTSIAGIVCFVAASSIFNQVLERDTDALMARTSDRPLVTHALSLAEVILFGIACSVTGFLLLALRVNMACAVGSAATMLVYALCYTPLKRSSVLCTTVGAVPGAMPAVLGWMASGTQNWVPAFALFAIFFVWQFPHFLAIAWIYRRQYAGAGLKMLPGNIHDGRSAGVIALVYAMAFVPVSMLPRYVGIAGDGYLAAAIVLSLGYLWLTVQFARDRTDRRARQLMFGSLLCLPALLVALVIDFVRLTS